MKKIAIELNTKSINEARKYLLNLKKQIPKMQQEFIEQLALWITDKADFYIDNSDIGSLVKSQIKGSWKYEKFTNGIKVVNKSDKSVYVEFGVGIEGQSDPHPNANNEGYEYNLHSEHKYAGKYHDENTWRFIKHSSDEIDLPEGSYETWIMGSGDLKIITRGTRGVWYAYNAIVDAKMELSKANGGEIGKMWEDIKARYIK
jgi:hypothetical protein